jgi:protease-4
VLVDSVAVARHLDPDSVRRLIDQGPFPAARALAAGLADTIAYGEQIDSLAISRAGEGTDTETFTRYDSRASWSSSRIAFVSASGTISGGRSRYEPMGGSVLGSETLCETLRDLRGDRSIKAVVLRIDSPGGESQASDEIWHEVDRLNRRKPVIVSMSDLAASGGYYIAAAATRIVAQPGTITGSIGVYGGKLNLLGLYKKLGLSVETLSRGRHAEMLSPIRDFDAEEGAQFQSEIDSTYQLFLRRVSAGRSISLADADSLGRGRVWTGEAALANGLVDTLGGIRMAYRLALRSAGLPEGQPFAVQEFPRPERTFLDRLVESWFDDEHSSDEALSRSFTPVMQAWLIAANFPAGRVLAVLPWSISVR